MYFLVTVLIDGVFLLIMLDTGAVVVAFMIMMSSTLHRACGHYMRGVDIVE